MMGNKEKKNLSRRDFIKGAAVVAGGGLIVGCAPSVVATQTPASQSTNAPAASGSTDTMNAATLAKKWAFEIPPAPIPDSSITETKEAEIIVVGAGTSGIVTALSAAEAGGKVILFAAGSKPVGRGGSNMAVYSKYMKSLDMPKMDGDRFLRAQLMATGFDVDTAKWYKWYNNSEEAMNWIIDHMADSGYELKCEQGNRGMDPNDPEYCPPGTHGWISKDMQKVGDGQPFVVESLAKKAAAAGVEFVYNVKAQQLIREDNNKGRVTAIIGKTADGKYIKFKGSKAIVLATGDFTVDPEMMAKYCPQALPYIVNMGKNVDPENGKVYGGLYAGQGQKMGLWVGAAWQRTYPNPAMVGAFVGACNMPYNATTGLVVNSKGVRFFNEQVANGFMFNLLRHQPDKSIYSIWDTAYATNAQPWYLNKTAYGSEPGTPEHMITSWDASVKSGSMVKGDTVEDVIKKLGLPASTIDEIKKYNGFCDSGEDTDFHKPKKYLLPISTAPFYGQSQKSPTVLTVLGGLRTNNDMQVCEADDTPIPGLYNVGTMVGDVFAGCYNFMIAGHNLGMTCDTFGYLTGRYIVKNEK
jgi:fumarate reductase flavoprotein subunit